MIKSIFKVCGCGNLMIHGCVYFTNRKRTQPIFSLKDARTMLEVAEQDGFISSTDKDDLVRDVAAAGIPEDGPDEEAIKAYRQEQEEYEKNIAELFEKLGMSKDQAIVIPVVDLNAPD